MRQIFLSYARVDLDRARKLYSELCTDPRVHVWFDQVDLMPGIRWEAAIVKAIRESTAFVALFSKRSSTEKGFRHSELREALEVAREFPDEQVFLVPARLDDCEPPMREVSKYNFADLFPDWEQGVSKLRSALHLKASVAKSRRTRVIRQPKADRPPEKDLFRVKLVSLDKNIPALKRVARGLNKAQTFFHLSHTEASSSPRARRVIEGEPHIDVDRLTRSFYRQFSTMSLDLALCVTERFVAFSDETHAYSNYLGARTPQTERVRVASVRNVEDYAAEAGVTMERAIAYGIVSDLAIYFLDADFHKAVRGCPVDFIQDHAAMVKGLRNMAFCKSCARALAKNPPLEKAFRQMLSWNG